MAIIKFALRFLRSNAASDVDIEDSLEDAVPSIKGSSLSTDRRLANLLEKLGDKS